MVIEMMNVMNVEPDPIYLLHGMEAPAVSVPFVEKKDWQPPEKLQEVSVKQKGKSALISWKPSWDKDASGYLIYKLQANPWEVMPEPLREKEKKDIEEKKEVCLLWKICFRTSGS